MTTQVKSGVLYLVGVPIGNYEDITLRALETLKQVDVIAAEDTRKAQRLLAHFSIQYTDLLSHGSHNEHHGAKGLQQLLADGKSIAFISDAGMPGISDPGYLLARHVFENGGDVEVIPGVTAATTAVVASGLPCDRFFFAGFLPRKTNERQEKLKTYAAYPETLVFYEAPHRILDMLQDTLEVLGDRDACLGRELTKTHEEYIRLPLSEILAEMQNRAEVRGEMTVIVQGCTSQNDGVDIDGEILQRLAEGKTVKQTRDEVAETFSLSKKMVYNRCLALKD